MCAPVTDQVMNGLAKTEQSPVCRYTPDGLLIKGDESVSKESTDLEDSCELSDSGDVRTEGFSGRWRWNSVELETDTVLAYNRVRCFDPTIGRWINGDPLGFESGDANCYRYVSTKPGAAILPGE